MSDDNVAKTRSLAKLFITIFLPACVIVISIFSIPKLIFLRQLCTLLIPITEIALIVILILLLKQGKGKMGIFLLFPGAIWLIAGPALDMLSTIRHSPDLSREGNVIARYLLDNGYKMNFILIYSIIAQALFVIVLLLLGPDF